MVPHEIPLTNIRVYLCLVLINKSNLWNSTEYEGLQWHFSTTKNTYLNLTYVTTCVQQEYTLIITSHHTNLEPTINSHFSYHNVMFDNN